MCCVDVCLSDVFCSAVFDYVLLSILCVCLFVVFFGGGIVLCRLLCVVAIAVLVCCVCWFLILSLRACGVCACA